MAKEPAAAADPGYPPGWADYPWPFPGPYPPGYSPTLTLVMTATDSIAYNGTASVTGSARDQGTYATNEPSAITWTATIAGSPINLRFNGETNYSSSLSSAVSFGTYWGATPSIEFELTEDNADDVVTLRGVYQLDGLWIEQTENIIVTVSAEFTSIMSYNPGAGPEAVLYYPTFRTFPFDADADVAVTWERTPGFAPPNEVYQVNGVTETYPYTLPTFNEYITVTVDEDGVIATINYTELADGQYLSISIPLSVLFTTATLVATLVIAGVTYTKTIVNSEPVQHWLRIFNDGTVVEINP